MRDAISYDARLPATRASKNQHRPVGGFDSFTLLGIKLIKKRQNEDSRVNEYFNNSAARKMRVGTAPRLSSQASLDRSKQGECKPNEPRSGVRIPPSAQALGKLKNGSSPERAKER